MTTYTTRRGFSVRLTKGHQYPVSIVEAGKSHSENCEFLRAVNHNTVAEFRRTNGEIITVPLEYCWQAQ